MAGAAPRRAAVRRCSAAAGGEDTIARSAAVRTLGTGSLRSPAAVVNASPMRWRAMTLAAISGTRHASPVVAWMIAAVARLSQAWRRPRAA